MERRAFHSSSCFTRFSSFAAFWKPEINFWKSSLCVWVLPTSHYPELYQMYITMSSCATAKALISYTDLIHLPTQLLQHNNACSLISIITKCGNWIIRVRPFHRGQYTSRHEVESCISTIAPNTLFDFWPTTSHADATSNTDRSSSLQHFHVHLAIFQILF